MSRFNPKELFSKTKIDKKSSLIFAFAPLEPYTANPIIREFAGRSGAQLVFRPKINPFHLLKAKEWQVYEKIHEIKELKSDYNEPIYDGVQILARPDDPIKDCVRYVSKNKHELGINFIDLNFSCPGHKVITQNRGGEMMQYPEKIRKVIEKTLKFTSLPVSVKIRRGYRFNNTPKEVCKVLRDYDIAWLTINRAPVRRANVDWEQLKQDITPFEQASDELEDRIPIIMNGDFEDIRIVKGNLEKIKPHVNIGGFMLGRGALGNPGVFSYLREELSSKIPNSNIPAFRKNISDHETFLIFKHLFEIIEKYTDGDSGRWTSIAQIKQILFWFVKQYYESRHQSLPPGYGFTKFTKQNFTKEELIRTMSKLIPVVGKKQWQALFNSLNN